MSELTKEQRHRRVFWIVVLVLVFLVIGGIFVPRWIYSHRTIAGISEPIQINLDDSEIYEISGNGYRVEMQYLASYDIKGLVVELDDYDKPGASAFDLAVPRDISLAWGKAAEFANEIDWGHAARTLNYKYTNSVLEKSGASRLELAASISNNHIIVDDGELRSEIKKVQIGDYIEMTGYLVRASFYDSAGNNTREVMSSLTRTDHNEHAFDTRTSCEVIYLTSIKWLD